LAEASVRTHIRVLHHILRLAIVAQDGTRHPIQPLVVAPHDDLVQRCLTAEDAGDHFRVVQFALLLGQDRVHDALLQLLECAGREALQQKSPL
jgi:hypothetical protein